jgi:hypothetical protein
VSGGSPPTSGSGRGGTTFPTDTPGIRRVELFVGDATLEFSPAEVARIVRYLLSG